MNKKNIFGLSKDFVLNIIASLLSTGVMQLVLYPQLASNLSKESYGTMLTIMGYVNVVTLAFGNNLCNARLLQQKEYDKIGKYGDFQLLVVFSSVLSAISIFLICYLQNLGSVLLLLGVSTATVFLTLKAYYLVAYRIELNYIKNLIANVVLAVGFIFGSFALIKYVEWPWLFTIASAICLVFVFLTSKIMKEDFQITSLFKKSLKLVVVLLLSGLIANSTTYLDRFIIHPVLGGEAVSTYATAAFFSKSINLVISPIISVILNYFALGKLKLTKKVFFGLSGIYIAIGVVFFISSITLGPLITGWLYPSLIEGARGYIFIVSIGLLIGIIGDFTTVLVLVNSPSYWQIILSVIKFVLYLALGIIFVNMLGIYGMCLAIVITNSVYYLTSFAIALINTLARGKNEKESKLVDDLETIDISDRDN